MSTDSGDAREITELLLEWSNGDEVALENLMPLVYGELRRMAQRHMRRQPSGHTLQTTELIHEAYLKIADNRVPEWKNRAHFFGVAAKAMRHILVDYARSKYSQKRGGFQQQLEFAETLYPTGESKADIVALDDALNRLAELDDRKVKVVEMKFFAGMKFDEIAEVLKISNVTVKRDWSFAKSWLLRELKV